jgi:hypothetical protein
MSCRACRSMTLPESLAHSRVMQSLSKHDSAGILGGIPVSCRACRSMTLPESLAHSRVMLSLSKHDSAGIVGPFPCHAEPVEA